ncbi:MAG: RAMP superfamily CRISPR-associated protein [Schleiferiaceae bacterium]|nr:RAMP superfamily CRISPR-associated protein [Schleiferiaceae bacterium]
MKANISIVFMSYWHCGSGVSGGAETDTLIKRDPSGMPFVPGKTLKGHLREAATWYSQLHPDTEALVTRIFGVENTRDSNGDTDKKSVEVNAGKAFFSDCYAHPQITRTLNKKSDLLTTTVYATAIEESGVAKNQSLRSMEVALPFTVYGRIDGLDRDEIDFVKTCMGLVKELGAGKTRGFGKCQLTFID